MVLFPLIIGLALVSVNHESNEIKEDRIVQCETLALIGAVTIGQFLEKAIEEGGLSEKALFNDTYIPIPDSTHPRHKTTYDSYFDSRMQEILDSYRQTEAIVYAVAADRYGYVPTHNSVFSLGDLDDPNNRTKLIIEDKARLTPKPPPDEPIQVYRMETGEQVWDIWAPIYVKDRHWGAFHVGISIEQIDREIATARNTSVFGTGIILLMLTVIVMMAASTVARPLEILRRAVEKTGNGDFSHRVSAGYCTELQSLSESFNQMAEKLDRKTKAEWMHKASLEEANNTLQHMVVTDELTRVHSRKYLFSRLGEEIASAERTGNKLSVIFFDVDGFKQINDRHGHRTGDQVLVQVVSKISTMLRPYDIMARYGGDEFVILVPGTN